MSLTFTDIFCGAGGSSIGLAGAGMELKLAANHWDRAIATHAANFRDAEHLCADVNNYDMRRLPRTDVLWASPICTEISPAGGRRRTRGQLDLLADGPVAAEGFVRTRATFHDVIRATEVHRYTAVLVENVVEVAWDWELFGWWVTGMDLLGYRHQFVSVSSAHVGGAGNGYAPQWRDRLYIVFTRLGVPLPDVAPRPLALCAACGVDVLAVQSWKEQGRRPIGKYRQQYVYVCPSSTCRHAVVEPYVLPAAAAIDWTDLGKRIGDRPRPLAAATVRRIRAGLDLFAGDPAFLAPSGGTWNEDPTPLDWPMRTRLANEKGFEALIAPPFAMNVNHHGDDGRPYPVDAAPLPPRTAKIGDGLVTPPFMTMLRKNATVTSIGEPLATFTTGTDRGGAHHYLTVPPGAFYVKNHGGYAEPRRMAKSVGEPLGTVVANGGHQALVVPYYRTGKAKSTAAPLDTVTARDRFALVDPAVEVDDCRFRMLQPREHLRAQRFPDSYVVTGNRGEQTMQAGNAVSANVAHWLGAQVAAALDGSAA